jgi:hypothetical protein
LERKYVCCTNIANPLVRESRLAILPSDLTIGRDDCLMAWIRTCREPQNADEDHPTGVES